jgi:hypothetical protein
LKAKKPNNKPNKSKLTKDCDRLWSIIVRQRDATCLYPGCNRQDLNAHHIFSRRNQSVRFDPENGVALCRGHHLFWAHSAYEEFRDAIIEKIGKKDFERLKAKSNLISKWTISELMTIRDQLKRLIDG